MSLQQYEISQDEARALAATIFGCDAGQILDVTFVAKRLCPKCGEHDIVSVIGTQKFRYDVIHQLASATTAVIEEMGEEEQK